MSVITKTKSNTLEKVLEELEDIRIQLKKFLLIIPQESIKEYNNDSQVRKAFLRANKIYPPK